jgi:hypothetical protein
MTRIAKPVPVRRTGLRLPEKLETALHTFLHGEGFSKALSSGVMFFLATEPELREMAEHLAYSGRPVDQCIRELKAAIRANAAEQDIQAWLRTLSPAERGKVLAQTKQDRMNKERTK